MSRALSYHKFTQSMKGEGAEQLEGWSLELALTSLIQPHACTSDIYTVSRFSRWAATSNWWRPPPPPIAT
jgi:hypothetical protein